MFCCKCLNITIKTKSSDLPKVDVLSCELLDSNDPFFKEDLVEAEVRGIAKEQPCLVQVRNVACWIVHRCINCSTDTHALHRERGAACVLINSNILSDKSTIAALKSSSSFSPVFRVVVTSNFETSTPEETDFHAGGGMQTTLAALQQQLTEALQREAQLVEERVRQYSEKLYAELEEFRSKAHDDHKTLSRLILESGRSNVSALESIQDQSVPPKGQFISLPPPPQKFQAADEGIRHPMTPLDQNTSRSRDSRRHSNPKLNMSPTKTESRPVPSVRVPNDAASDSEGLFQLDGMDENPPTTFQSEDETDTDAETGGLEDGIAISRVQSSISNLAKSLPVSVPIFPGARGHGNDFEEDDLSPRDPMDIAASIKALARSVHGDTVFGDLPRPRFSSQI
ncbi:Proline-rich AKT1 substrate 1 [Frankliniella fusca]|uniref:Proline-rich AKT1 substrate 1 n=1 Tax=Frankliniella fusca TaxID=407009 RepID=A0AAE1H9N7_9NEOP|nr:Proline-rich AKT1 substrate 1 [Frankliniella fusca]